MINIILNPTGEKIEKITGLAMPAQHQVTVRKNIILCYVSDSTGCGYIRTIFPMIYMNAIYGRNQVFNPIITPYFIFQNDILIRTRAIHFQRQMTKENLEIIKKYKEMQSQYKYKMVYDIDDMIWDWNEKQGGSKETGIPSYNFASNRITREYKEATIEIMNLMDIITVSTNYLKKYIKEVLKVKTEIVVVQNTVPLYLYGNGKKDKPELKADIKIPKVMYCGSPTHYSNGNSEDPEKMKGDLDNAWSDWVLKSVKENSIKFYCLGGLPWFWEEIKDKIISYNWVTTLQYPQLLKEILPDFIISPLIYNEFNCCKSDIKFIESASIGTLHIGTIFTNGKPSPYDNTVVKAPDNITVEQIDDLIKKYCNKDEYNAAIQKQYLILETSGRYTESPEFINSYIKIYT